MSELRKDPFTGKWVITGTRKESAPLDYLTTRKEIRTHCPFCEGNELDTLSEVFAIRKFATTANTPGWKVRVIPNKFKIVDIKESIKRHTTGVHFIYEKFDGFGVHEIIIETPLHIGTLAEVTGYSISYEQLKDVLITYQQRIKELKKNKNIRYISIYKNQDYGPNFSIIHSHSHVLGLPFIPFEIKQELINAKQYYIEKKRCMFCDIIKEELDIEKRIVEKNDNFVGFVPFAPKFPFSVLLFPLKHNCDFLNTASDILLDLSKIIKNSFTRICRLLQNPPVNLVLHNVPNYTVQHGIWETIENDYHWHFEILPHPVPAQGLEWGYDTYINPPLPENAAEFLRKAL